MSSDDQWDALTYALYGYKAIDRNVSMISTPISAGKSYWNKHLTEGGEAKYFGTFTEDNEKETKLKTKGLTIIEAVVALKEGKCKAVKLGCYNATYAQSANLMCLTSESVLSNDWELIEPKLTTETRYVEKWVVIFKEGDSLTYNTKEIAEANSKYREVIKIEHIKIPYEVEVEPEEKFRVELDNVSWETVCGGCTYPYNFKSSYNWKELKGKKGKLIFEED